MNVLSEFQKAMANMVLCVVLVGKQMARGQCEFEVQMLNGAREN